MAWGCPAEGPARGEQARMCVDGRPPQARGTPWVPLTRARTDTGRGAAFHVLRDVCPKHKSTTSVASLVEDDNYFFLNYLM